jgi:hypothetical protein
MPARRRLDGPAADLLDALLRQYPGWTTVRLHGQLALKGVKASAETVRLAVNRRRRELAEDPPASDPAAAAAAEAVSAELQRSEPETTAPAAAAPAAAPRRRRKPTRAIWLDEDEEPEGGDLARVQAQRPRTRGACRGAERPCPWVGCRHNLYLHVLPSGAIQVPDGVQPDEMPPDRSCALDLVEQHPSGMTLEQVAQCIGGLTRERVRQIECRALSSALRHLRRRGLISPEELEQLRHAGMFD